MDSHITFQLRWKRLTRVPKTFTNRCDLVIEKEENRIYFRQSLHRIHKPLPSATQLHAYV